MEEDLEYHKLGFSSSKFRYDDYEKLLNEGFTRCGSYFYMRNIQKSCCEAYQYRVDTDAFKPSRSQKKVIKKFHRYLNHGRPTGGDPLAIENPKNIEEDGDIKMTSPEEIKEEEGFLDKAASKMKN